MKVTSGKYLKLKNTRNLNPYLRDRQYYRLCMLPRETMDRCNAKLLTIVFNSPVFEHIIHTHLPTWFKFRRSFSARRGRASAMWSTCSMRHSPRAEGRDINPWTLSLESTCGMSNGVKPPIDLHWWTSSPRYGHVTSLHISKLALSEEITTFVFGYLDIWPIYISSISSENRAARESK